MDLVNNRAFIVSEIERTAREELERMRAEHVATIGEMDRAAGEELARTLEDMRRGHEDRLEAIRKRSSSRSALATKRVRLEAEGTLRYRVLERIRASLDASVARSIVAAMQEHEPVRIEGPRIECDGMEPNLDSFTFRAHLADGSFIEVSEDDIIARIEPRVREAIAAWTR